MIVTPSPSSPQYLWSIRLKMQTDACSFKRGSDSMSKLSFLLPDSSSFKYSLVVSGLINSEFEPTVYR